MKDKYIFREITKEEIPHIIHLILERMKWMDEKGIKQWNVTKYDTNEVVCGAVLKEKDKRWKDDEPSIYLRNFVTKIGEKGAGIVFMQFAEEYAMQVGKKYFRLDSPEGNNTLEQYYEKLGYVPVGNCVDGLYKGILRQKLLVE